MDKNLLKDGNLIFPNRLKKKKKYNIGIIGSGNIAKEYIKVLKSFNHNLNYLITLTNNINANKLAKKYNAKLINNIKEIDQLKDVDFWIVCSSWNKLKKIFFDIKHIKKPILFEKSIILNSLDFRKIIKDKKFDSIKKNISFAYNRNYYDYIYFLIHLLTNQKIEYGNAYFYDPYKNLIDKKKIPEKNLCVYITSHWISLVLKIFNLCKIKISKIVSKTINKKKNFKKLTFYLKTNKNKFEFDFFNFPNLPKNHEINFVLENQIIKISPIERIKLYQNLQSKKTKSQNKYLPKIKIIDVDDKFKPGFRFQYYDFIKRHFLNKKTFLQTDIKDLIEIYKISKMLK